MLVRIYFYNEKDSRDGLSLSVIVKLVTNTKSACSRTQKKGFVNEHAQQERLPMALIETGGDGADN